VGDLRALARALSRAPAEELEQVLVGLRLTRARDSRHHLQKIKKYTYACARACVRVFVCVYMYVCTSTSLFFYASGAGHVGRGTDGGGTVCAQVYLLALGLTCVHAHRPVVLQSIRVMQA